jgi:hypothetical protein
MATLGWPIAGALRIRALAAAPVRDDRPRIAEGVLRAGAAAALWDDARAIAPILSAAYASEPLQVARAAPSVEQRAHNDACVPLTGWVCDGLAELEAIALLLGCARLDELDAAVADALDDWQTHGGGAVPRVARLAPAISDVLVALEAQCARGASGNAALAVVAPILGLVELMRRAGPAAALPERALNGAPGLARASAHLHAMLDGYRGELARLGAAIDRAAGTGDRIAVALGAAGRMHQVAAIAAAITAWIDGPGAANAAQVRWRGATAAIEQRFVASLAGVRRLVPLPP